MEFRFDLNEIFHQPIVEIGSSLVPPGFSGDKRALWDTQSKVTQIVNAMGEASAHAQGLSKPITTADRLRNSEHRLYLLVDQNANNGKGAVTGMLKTGEKGLYVFDREGQHYQISPPCVLDFYIHESRQRSGFGKRLFEHMLQREKIEPVKMAIDRPSEKFLGFLNKHYSLNTPVKQMNNYVVFDGFFPRAAESAANRTMDGDKSYTPSKKQSANGLQQNLSSSPYGRYGAPRPPCSMGQIIHNDSPVIKRNQEPTGVRSEPVTNLQGSYHQYYGNQHQAWQATQSVPNIQNYPLNSGDIAPNTVNFNQNQVPSWQYAPYGDMQPTMQKDYYRSKAKEPLIPQSFDGTLRKTPHTSQSAPIPLNIHQVLQQTASAPISYPVQQPQMLHQQQYQHQPEMPQHQHPHQQQSSNYQPEITQYQYQHQHQQVPSMHQPNQQNIANIPSQHQIMGPVSQHYQQTQPNMNPGQPLHQSQSSNYYQTPPTPPIENQLANSQTNQQQPMEQHQQAPTVVVANITNQLPPSPTPTQYGAYSQHIMANQIASSPMQQPTQSPIVMDANQPHHQTPTVIGQHPITNQIAPSPMQAHQQPTQSPVVTGDHQQHHQTPTVISQHSMTNQMQAQQHQHHQIPSSPIQAQQHHQPQSSTMIGSNSQHLMMTNQIPPAPMEVQQHHQPQSSTVIGPDSQHLMTNQILPSPIQAQQQQHHQLQSPTVIAPNSQHLMTNQTPPSQQQHVMGSNQIAAPPMENQQQSLATNQIPLSADQGGVSQSNQEVDLSKGYPPQHFQSPVSARPPIIIRN